MQEKPLMEIVQLAALKRARQQRNRVRVFLPAKYLPPKEVRVYRTVRVSTIYGTLEIFCKPQADPPGWEFFVRFKEDNAVLPPEVGKKLLEKLTSQAQ